MINNMHKWPEFKNYVFPTNVWEIPTLLNAFPTAYFKLGLKIASLRTYVHISSHFSFPNK